MLIICQKKFGNPKQLGNPFMVDDSKELIQLWTKDIMGDVRSIVIQIEELGKNQRAEFRKTRVFAHMDQLDKEK